MSRARNIKPAFFANEELGECSPLARLLFIGLWTLADFKGDLEWRPKRIKAQLLPYDQCEVEALVSELVAAELVRRYTAGGLECLSVCNFVKHQNPHKNEKEKGSSIPAWDGVTQAVDSQTLTINRDKSGLTVSTPEQNESAPADSLLLIPDPLSLKPDTTAATMSAEKSPAPGKPVTPAKNGKRWAEGEEVPREWKLEAFEKHGLDKAVIQKEAEAFANYWMAKAGKDATKVNWQATWRNWIARAAEKVGINGKHWQQYQTAQERRNEANDSMMGEFMARFTQQPDPFAITTEYSGCTAGETYEHK